MPERSFRTELLCRVRLRELQRPFRWENITSPAQQLQCYKYDKSGSLIPHDPDQRAKRSQPQLEPDHIR